MLQFSVVKKLRNRLHVKVTQEINEARNEEIFEENK